VGFESAVTFRHHFVRQLRTTPSDYRNAFTGRPGLEGGPAGYSTSREKRLIGEPARAVRP
jgi:hypothetical protein